MLKNFFYAVATLIVVGFVLIIGYNNWGWFGGSKSDDKNGVFYRNGQPVNPAARAACSESCLKAYPAGSKYEGYYYCVPGCSGGTIGSGTYGRDTGLPSHSTSIPGGVPGGGSQSGYLPVNPNPGGGSGPAPGGGGGGPRPSTGSLA